MSSVRSSIFRSIEQEVDSSDAATGVDMNNVVARVNVGEVATIEVDTTEEWSESCTLVPPVSGYDWAPYEVEKYVYHFIMGQSLEEFVGIVDLVRATIDPEHFKLFVCKKN